MSRRPSEVRALEIFPLIASFIRFFPGGGTAGWRRWLRLRSFVHIVQSKFVKDLSEKSIFIVREIPLGLVPDHLEHVDRRLGALQVSFDRVRQRVLDLPKLLHRSRVQGKDELHKEKLLLFLVFHAVGPFSGMNVRDPTALRISQIRMPRRQRTGSDHGPRQEIQDGERTS